MRSLEAVIDLRALSANLALARAYAALGCSTKKHLVAVIKANAYGHGLVPIAHFLSKRVDMLAVASIDEALILRQAEIATPLLVLGGAFDNTEIPLAKQHKLTLVAHHPRQLKWIEQSHQTVDFWLKIETGMHRMGLDKKSFTHFLGKTTSQPVVMHHHACADTPEHELNHVQMETFTNLTSDLNILSSCANSAVLCAQKLGAKFVVGDYVRPGLMLYGASPLANTSAATLGLKPVMQLQSELISVKPVAAGDSVGYGATFTAPQPGYVGVVACGYGDGYPREFIARARPSVRIGNQRYPLAGRVSMDSLAIWLGQQPQPLGSKVILWGKDPTIDELAKWSGTIPYTLLTRVAARVKRTYVQK